MVNKPQEEEAIPPLEELMHRAAQALEEAGVTVQDLLDEHPATGNELMRQQYGAHLWTNSNACTPHNGMRRRLS